MSTAWADAARALAQAGIRRVYGLPGDDMLAVRALQSAGIDLVVTSEQRHGAYAAAGDAAVAGRDDAPSVGVVVAGRGPGAAALVPALLELATGGHPVICLIGGPAEGADARSFQYADQAALLRPVAKDYARLTSDTDAAAAVSQAIATALDAPRGPVVVEIPDPLPHAFAEPAGRTEGGRVLPRTAWVQAGAPRPPESAADAAAAALIATSRRPLVLVGGGALAAGPAVVSLAERLGAPILGTASGRGAVPEDHPLWWGLSGLYMHPVVREAVAAADLLISVGSRLEETAVEYLPDLPVLRLDRDASVVRRPSETLVVADAAHAASWADRAAQRDGSGWGATIARVGGDLLAWRAVVRSGRRGARDRLGAIVAAISDALPKDVVVCHENGAADMWSYLFPVFRLPPHAVDIAPSEQTTLGFGVGAAVGAATASSGPVVALCGDGAFDFVVRERAAFGPAAPGAVYVVFDNGGYGWLELQHRETGDEPASFTGLDIGRADAGGRVAARTIADAEEAAEVMSWAFERATRGPVIVRVPCHIDESAPVGSDSW